jgi:hypothetical protein
LPTSISGDLKVRLCGSLWFSLLEHLEHSLADKEAAEGIDGRQADGHGAEYCAEWVSLDAACDRPPGLRRRRSPS